jgi:serine/threonine-protein phosphatase 2A regulatory subunit B'
MVSLKCLSSNESQALEPAWPHLQIVYEFLLRFIISTETDQKLLKKYITTEFVSRLLLLFDSEDPRERDYQKTILHRIYGKFMPLRSFIRKAVNNVFFRFVYESERHNGIAELLEILGSIINGFALPLKPEHKQFLMRVLVPLHKPKQMSLYHPQLSYCVTQFVEKDPALAPEIIQGLVRFWPRSCSKKEVMYLNELEEILERLTVNELEAASAPLFRQLAKCVQSSHFQVAERAICLLNYDILLRYISSHREQTMPPLLRSLQTASAAHWNPTVCELTSNNLRLLMEMDEAMAERYAQELLPQYDRDAAALQSRRAAWEALDARIGSAPTSIVSALSSSSSPSSSSASSAAASASAASASEAAGVAPSLLQQRLMLAHRASLTHGPLALKHATATAAASLLSAANPAAASASSK